MEAKVVEKILTLCPEGGAFIVPKAGKAPQEADAAGERWIQFEADGKSGPISD